MQPAPPMPQEIDAGFYPDFERGWRTVELAGRALMLLAVAATLVGLLGGGPVSLWPRTAAAGSLQVEYAPVVRFGTPTGLTLRAMTDAGQDRVAITFPEGIVRRYGLQSVFPQPTEWTSGDNGDIRMVFAVSSKAGETMIQMSGLPTGSGVMDLSGRLDGGPAASWSQIVLP